MKFRSKKGLITGLILWSVSLSVSAITFMDLFYKNKPFIASITILPTLLPIWFWFDTYYIIEEGLLKYKSAFITGSIKIIEIKTIFVNKTMYVGLKPALASKGCIIKYAKWDDIYLSPENQELFNAELLKINPAIKVVNT